MEKLDIAMWILFLFGTAIGLANFFFTYEREGVKSQLEILQILLCGIPIGYYIGTKFLKT